MSRLDAIYKVIESSPNDPFPRYGLAMELKNSGQLDEAHRAFTELEQRFPDYVPQYLMHHTVLIALENKAEARRVLEAGIVVSRTRGDAHALSELQTALDVL